MSLTLVDFLALAVVVIFVLVVSRRGRHGNAKFPPSPKGHPLFGNIFDVPATGAWAEYARWSKELGSPIISMDMLSMRIIIVNDMNTVQDLFDRRATIYNNRPRLPWLNEAGGFDWDWGFTEDIERWKAGRRDFDSQFRQVAARRFRPKALVMAHNLLRKLLESPDDFMEHCRYASGSLMLDITYGMSDRKEIDSFIHLAESGSKGIEKAGDRNIVNIFPWTQHIPSFLSFLPGMGWKREVDEFRAWGFSMRDVPYDWYKGQENLGLARECVTTELLHKIQNSSDMSTAEETELKNVVGAAYIGGSDTRRAREEVDRVVGQDRLPDFSDENKLPYLSAIVKELARWIAPTTAPHSVAEDDVYNGYLIPKGSVIFGNTWGILHDPDVYENPDSFAPERFLGADGKLDPMALEPSVAFGYGRRICPGRFLALDTVWLVAASLVATFDFRCAKDANGKDIIPSADIGYGLLGHPKPFKCQISPRSDKAIRLVENFQSH